MEVWFTIVISLCILALLKYLLFNKVSENHGKLPPGPLHIPILSKFLWLRKPFFELELTLRKLHAKYGPFITIYIGFSPAIFVANCSLAHKALIQNSAVFADRPAPPPTAVIVSSDKHNINSASYGHTWRLFRRNLTSEILHPSHMKSYSHARKRVLDILLDRLGSNTESVVKDHFQYSMFCLLVLMCFGDKLGETQIRKIEEVERRLLLSSGRFANCYTQFFSPVLEGFYFVSVGKSCFNFGKTKLMC